MVFTISRVSIRKLFKIKVEFEDDAPITSENINKLAEEIKQSYSQGGIYKAIAAKKAAMRQVGDYSYINKALFKKVYDNYGVAFEHVTDDGQKYFVYKAINAWGDSFRANEFWATDHKSVLENGFMKVEDVDNNVIISKFLDGKKVKTKPVVANIQSSSQPFYEGDIKQEPNTIFVFGSNPEGRHGLGAAKTAVDKFGAKYGQGEGLQGNSYALPTKDLRVKANNSLKSISPEKITESIKKLYTVARQNPDKQFKIAYRNTTKASLNGYTGLEMIDMFNAAGPRPSNIIFSKEWVDTGKLSQSSKTINFEKSFSPKRQEEILNNFATKHKMTKEAARKHINEAIASKGQEVINKLKECY